MLMLLAALCPAGAVSVATRTAATQPAQALALTALELVPMGTSRLAVRAILALGGTAHAADVLPDTGEPHHDDEPDGEIDPDEWTSQGSEAREDSTWAWMHEDSAVWVLGNPDGPEDPDACPTSHDGWERATIHNVERRWEAASQSFSRWTNFEIYYHGHTEEFRFVWANHGHCDDTRFYISDDASLDEVMGWLVPRSDTDTLDYDDEAECDEDPPYSPLPWPGLTVSTPPG